MTTLILVAVAAVGVFVIGVVRPEWSRRIVRFARRHLKPVEKWAEKRPQPIKSLVRGPAKASRKVTEKSAEQGRETRHKIDS